MTTDVRWGIMSRMGKTTPEVSMKIKLPADLRQRIKVVAAQAVETMNDVVVKAVRAYCK